MSALVGGVGPWPCLLRGTALCYGCGPAGGWVRLPTWLAEPPRDCGLLQANWWVGLCPTWLSVWLGVGGLGLVLGQLVGWQAPGSDSLGGKFQCDVGLPWCNNCGTHSPDGYHQALHPRGSPRGSLRSLSKINNWVWPGLLSNHCLCTRTWSKWDLMHLLRAKSLSYRS